MNTIWKLEQDHAHRMSPLESMCWSLFLAAENREGVHKLTLERGLKLALYRDHVNGVASCIANLRLSRSDVMPSTQETSLIVIAFGVPPEHVMETCDEANSEILRWNVETCSWCSDPVPFDRRLWEGWARRGVGMVCPACRGGSGKRARARFVETGERVDERGWRWSMGESRLY
jgi:hypothetical protein